MRNIVVLGAGRSSAALIGYLLDHANDNQWSVTVGDTIVAAAADRVKDHPRGKAIAFDIHAEDSDSVIRSADIVVSLLPPHLHPIVAAKCVQHGKHMVNASYVSPEMKELHHDAKAKGLVFLSECGLDPGIDHMSAMQVIDKIRNSHGKLVSFESFTGGLIAPETDPENPWRYKFTWNPRNVVMAGQGTAKYISQGKFKYIPYQQLFARTTPVNVPGHGQLEGYANRDSLQYIETYGLHDIRTMLRGTLRYKGFCSAWNILVQLGCCDDSYKMDGVRTMTHRDFIESFLSDNAAGPVQEQIAKQFSLSSDSGEIRRLEWSGFFSDEPVGLENGTPAQVVEHILKKRWTLDAGDLDQIIMWHRFVYEHGGATKEIQASLVATGSDAINTAMAQTVGLPLAIASKLILNKRISSTGVVIPTTSEFYGPILAELRTLGIELSEREVG